MPRLLPALILLSFLGCSGSRKPAGEAAAPAPSPGTGVAATLPAPDPREAKLAVAVTGLLEDHHVRGVKIGDDMSRKAFDLYLRALDPGKMFLLAADADALRVHADTIDDELHAGKMDLAHDGAKAFAARLEVVSKVVADLLARPFDSSDEEYVELDADKLELARTEDELRQRWRQRLELEVLERVATMEERLAAASGGDAGPAALDAGVGAGAIAEIPTTPEGREAKARADLADTYAARFARLAKPDPLDAASELINAVTAAFDPHTTYLPPADEANFDIAMSGSLEGIGAVLREDDHFIRVVELVPGGASWRHGGLDPGDLILAVAQQGEKAVDVADMRIDEVVAMIRGKKGTVVTLSVQKPTGDVVQLSITRDVVEIEDAYARGATVKRNGAKRAYGYIYLPSFYGGQGATHSAAADVKKLLAELAEQHLAGVILDLRSNGGGILGDAVDLTGLLIDKGPVVQTEGEGEHDVLDDEDPGTTFDGPVIVMVDRFTASASEIVSGALQDYQRALIVGTGPTHGKGTVQVLADLDRVAGRGSNLGVLKLTFQQYFRVSGASTQWKGVVPDIVLPDPAAHVDSRERDLPNSIPWSEIDGVKHDVWPRTYKIEDLAAKSAARVAKDEVLSKVAERSALLKKRLDETKVPLQKDAWEKRRQQRRDELTAAIPDPAAGPARMVVTVLDQPEGKAKPSADGKIDDRVTRWRDALARDAWVDEALAVMDDLVAASATSGHSR